MKSEERSVLDSVGTITKGSAGATGWVVWGGWGGWVGLAVCAFMSGPGLPGTEAVDVVPPSSSLSKAKLSALCLRGFVC